LLELLMGEKVGSGYMLVILQTPLDMKILFHMMAERQGFIGVQN